MTRLVVTAIALLPLLGAAAESLAAPALTEQQRRMLAETGETLSHQAQGSAEAETVPMPLEQPGLYALLRNAVAWDSSDERGAAVPDYDALYGDPAAYRGKVMLIEGELKRAQPLDVSRSGPWGERITEWVLEVSRDPLDSVVLLLPDPEGVALRAKPGVEVRMPSRFYMAQRVEVAGGDGRWGVFLTFVGPTPERVVQGGGGTPWLQPLLIFALVFLGLAILYVLRKAMSPQPRPLQRRYREHKGRRDESFSRQREGAEPSDPLPEDPAEAMEKLAERQAR